MLFQMKLFKAKHVKYESPARLSKTNLLGFLTHSVIHYSRMFKQMSWKVGGKEEKSRTRPGIKE